MVRGRALPLDRTTRVTRNGREYASLSCELRGWHMSDSGSSSRALELIAANYVKRWLEGNAYEPLARTEAFRRARSSSKVIRFGAEAALNLLAVLFDRKFAADSALRRIVKEVGLDAAPEISKRLVNGTSTPPEREVVNALLEMDPEQSRALLGWLYETSPAERARLFNMLASLEPEAFARLAQMSAADREKYLSILNRDPEPRDRSDSSEWKAVADQIRSFRARRNRSR